MTLNLIWSDAQASYLVADSATTHYDEPAHDQTSLGQPQRLPTEGKTVEEGAQKLIRLPGATALALCGDADALVEFAGIITLALAEMRPDAILHHFRDISSDKSVRLTIATPFMDPPFLVLQSPEKSVEIVGRGEHRIMGSLADERRRFLDAVVGQLLLLSVDESTTPAERLVAGLACATTMAGHFDLPQDYIGGAFFGAFVAAPGFSWQPDVTYLFYDPRFGPEFPLMNRRDAIDAAPGSLPIAETELVTCRVRDDVSVASSSITNRSVAAYSTVMTKDIDAWSARWSEPFSRFAFGDCHYFALIPRIPGMIAVVRNDGSYMSIKGTRLLVHDELVNELHRTPYDGRYALRLFRQSQR